MNIWDCFLRATTIANKKQVGSGCGAVGRAVASDSRGPGFESSHWQLLFNIYLMLTVWRLECCRYLFSKKWASYKANFPRKFMAHWFGALWLAGKYWTANHSTPTNDFTAGIFVLLLNGLLEKIVDNSSYLVVILKTFSPKGDKTRRFTTLAPDRRKKAILAGKIRLRFFVFHFRTPQPSTSPPSPSLPSFSWRRCSVWPGTIRQKIW